MAEPARELVVVVTHGADHELSSVALTIANGGMTAGLGVSVFLTSAAVDPEHLALRAAAGEAEVRLLTGVVRDEDRPGGHPDQVHRASIAERHAFNGARLYELADFRCA